MRRRAPRIWFISFLCQTALSPVLQCAASASAIPLSVSINQLGNWPRWPEWPLRTTKALAARLPFRHGTWWHLRSLGEIRAFKASYATLLFAPLIAKEHGLRNVLGLGTLVIGLAYFAAVFLFLATFLYDAFCPTIIKRFAVPIDYFRELLQASEAAIRVHLVDVPPKTFGEAHTEYDNQARRLPNVRRCCLVSYLLAGACMAALLADRAYQVAYSLF